MTPGLDSEFFVLFCLFLDILAFQDRVSRQGFFVSLAVLSDCVLVKLENRVMA